MLILTVYCKSHFRRPVRTGFAPLYRDPQADIPRAWCPLCGGEIFEHGQELCTRCRSAKGAIG